MSTPAILFIFLLTFTYFHFFTQVLAILTWTIVPAHGIAKIVHVFWQTAALATLIASIIATVKNKNNIMEDHLTSMHSWVGVATVAMFCINYVFGLTMGLITTFNPSNGLRKAFDLTFIHRSLGSTAFGLTVLAICLGIMSQFSRSGCYYTETTNNQANYNNLPQACKIANGLGIAVIATGIVVITTVSVRLHLLAREEVIVVEDRTDKVIAFKEAKFRADEENKATGN